MSIREAFNTIGQFVEAAIAKDLKDPDATAATMSVVAAGLVILEQVVTDIHRIADGIAEEPRTASEDRLEP